MSHPNMDSPPPPSSLSFNQVEETDPDPFDDDLDDSLFASIQIPECSADAPPPKKFKKSEDDVNNNSQPGGESSDGKVTKSEVGEKVYESEPQPHHSRAVINEGVNVKSSDDCNGDDPFADSNDDEQMYEIAEAIELSEDMLADEEDEDDNDGVPVQNKFKTGLGRPHPMLIPHIYEKILSRITCPTTLKSARLVCKAWKDTLQSQTFDHVTLRNLNHVTGPYPYGLGLGSRNPNFKPPNPAPEIKKLIIADPCTKFTLPEVDEFFRKNGSKLKYIGFDANLYCRDHWVFLRNLLVNWCGNLEELELIGVTCVQSLLNYSEIWSEKKLGLKRFVVRCGDSLDRDHHHYSSVVKRGYVNKYYTLDRLDCRIDGGLITKLLRVCPELREFVLHFNFSSLSGYFTHIRAFRASLANLQVLEVVGVGGFSVSAADIRLLRRCSMSLVSLKIGPLSPNIAPPEVERFLSSLATTLRHLNLCGVQPAHNDNDRLGVVRFDFPEMPFLRTLTITNLSRMRIGNLEFLYRAPGLESVEFGCEVVAQRFKTQVFRRISGLFNGGGVVNEHPCLREFKLSGDYAHVVDHGAGGRVFNVLCPRVRKIGVTCRTGGAAVMGCLDAYSGLVGVEELSLSVVHGGADMRDFAPFCSVFGSGRFEFLTRYSVSVPPGTVPLRIRDVRGFGGKLYRIELDGVVIHDDESHELALTLSSRVNYTHFKNCKIVKPGKCTVFGYAGKKSRPLDNVTLTLVNVHVLAQEYFRLV